MFISSQSYLIWLLFWRREVVSEKEEWNRGKHDVFIWLAMVTCEMHPFKTLLQLISEKTQLCDFVLLKQDSSRSQSVSSHTHLGLKAHSRLTSDICEPSHTDWAEVRCYAQMKQMLEDESISSPLPLPLLRFSFVLMSSSPWLVL